jgi:hypothetical protein
MQNAPPLKICNATENMLGYEAVKHCILTQTLRNVEAPGNVQFVCAIQYVQQHIHHITVKVSQTHLADRNAFVILAGVGRKDGSEEHFEGRPAARSSSATLFDEKGISILALWTPEIQQVGSTLLVGSQAVKVDKIRPSLRRNSGLAVLGGTPQRQHRESAVLNLHCKILLQTAVAVGLGTFGTATHSDERSHMIGHIIQADLAAPCSSNGSMDWWQKGISV